VASVQDPAGVVASHADVTVLDTREMPWERADAPVAGQAGHPALRKVLVRDAEGEPIISLQALAREPGPTDWFSHSAREFSLCLDGELHQREQGIDEDLVLREGDWTDRRAESVHALASGGSPTGASVLTWRVAGDDVLLGRPKTLHLSEEVPFSRPTVENPASGQSYEGLDASGDDAAGVLVDSSGVSILRTRRMPWQRSEVGLQKPLSFDSEGHPTVILRWVPPGRYPTGRLPHRVFHKYHEFTYIVAGDLNQWRYDGPEDEEGELVVFRKGYFMDRQPGGIHGPGVDEHSVTGCTFLIWRTLSYDGFVNDSDWAHGYSVHA
jgi:hypothetical protein